jgi:hypothetical protein
MPPSWLRNSASDGDVVLDPGHGVVQVGEHRVVLTTTSLADDTGGLGLAAEESKMACVVTDEGRCSS